MKEILKALADKGSSGRYYLTVISGLVFAYGVYARIIPAEATVSIITAVFISYFQRGDRGSNGNAKVPDKPV